MDRLSAMEMFVRIVETGSLSAAAREFDTTQPTVSRQLRALERRLRTQLLQRSTRHSALTETGRVYYEDCRRILAEVGAVEANAGGLEAEPRGLLKVNTSVALGEDYIAPATFNFMAQHPDLIVNLTLNERFVDLVEEGIDVAVRFGPLRHDSLIARRLASTRRLTVASPGYLRKRGTPRIPSDLSAHSCVLFNYEPADEWTYRGAEGETRVKVSGRFCSNNGHAIRGALVSGIGIGWLPEALIHGELQEGQLKLVLPDYEMPTIDVHAVYVAARHIPAKVRLYIGHLESALQRESSFLAGRISNHSPVLS